MADFKKLLSDTKAQVKELLSKDSSKEQIEKITQIDKQLDSLLEEHGKTEQEVITYKDMVIEQVKNTGVKNTGADDSGADDTKTPSLDDVLASELKKIEAEKKDK